MIIALFLSVLTASSLMFGAWLATRWAQAGVLHTSILAGELRGWDVNDAADMAETACDWGREL